MDDPRRLTITRDKAEAHSQTQHRLTPPPPDIEQGFRNLYPVMPTPHIVANVSAMSGKRVRTVQEAVQHTTIWRHLAPVDSDQHAVLGIMPTEPVDEVTSRTHFLVLDLDVDDLEPLQDAAAYLERFGVPAYINRSTSGRGWHLVVFTAEPVSGVAGAAVARRLAELVRYISPSAVDHLDVFPSSPSSGMRVLLPYRGASVDGLGFNPLLVPTTLEAVPLTHTDRIQRARVANLAAALRALNQLDLDPLYWYDQTPPVEEFKLATLDGTDPRIEHERQRVERHYPKAKGQYLILGFAGFMALHDVPVNEAIGHVYWLVKNAGEDRRTIDQRLSAVTNTYHRREHGRTVAFRKFYEQAGVEPPSALREPPMVAIDAVLSRAAGMRWQGNSGYTDFAVLVVLADCMRMYGRQPTSSTGEVAVACRMLADLTNGQPLTVLKALRRLEALGLVEIDRTVDYRGQAFTYRLRAEVAPDPPATPTQSSADFPAFMGQAGGLKDCADVFRHPAFHQRALGAKAAYVTFLLLALGPQSREDLQRRGPASLVAAAETLVTAGIAWHGGGRFMLLPAWRRTCDDIAAGAKTHELRANKRRRIDAERAEFLKRYPKPTARGLTNWPEL